MVEGDLARYTVELRTGRVPRRRAAEPGERQERTAEIWRPAAPPDRTMELGDDDLVELPAPPLSLPRMLPPLPPPVGLDAADLGGGGLRGLLRGLLFRLGWLRLEDPIAPGWSG